MFLVHRAAVDPLVVSWIGTALAVGYAVYVTYRGGQNGPAGGSAKGGNPINLKIKKDTAKVVDNVDVEDLGNKAVFCRCWRSKNFPYCDGAHGAHNEATGDNVGPLIVNKYQKQ